MTALVLCGLFVAAIIGVAAAAPEAHQGLQALGAGLTFGAGAGLAASWVIGRRLPVVVLGAAVAGAGAWRAAAAFSALTQPWADAPAELARVVAVVDAPVETRGATARVYARIERAVHPPDAAPPVGRVRLTTAALPPVELSDRIEVAGRFYPADPATADGRRLLGGGIIATSDFPDVLPLGRADANLVQAAAHALRAHLRAGIERSLSEPQSSLLSGLLVGSVGGMPQDFRLALQASGTTHIVVVSGYNISLVASALGTALRGARGLAAAVPLVGVWGFTLLAGASPPSIRAAIMATIALVAIRSGRGRDALAALALAAMGMLAVDPHLVADLSFQLSAFATIGLITLHARVAALLGALPGPVREPVSATLAAQLATAPLLAWVFHELSVVAPLANVLAAPAIPLATIAGAILMPIPAATSGAAPLVGAALWLPTTYLVSVIEAFSRLPGAMLPVGDVPPILALLYALGLVAWAAAPTPEGRSLLHTIGSARLAGQAVAAASLAAIGSLAWTGLATAPPPLVLSVLDVGDGEALFVRTPAQRTLLVDGGPNPAALLGQLGRRLNLAERNLSVVVLTRADSERLPGNIAALERYPAALAAGPPEEPTSALFARWQRLTDSAQRLRVDQAVTIQVEPGVAIELLPTGPLPGPAGSSAEPQRTLIVRVIHQEVSFLVAPAITAEAARAASAGGWPLAASALLVPRQGEPSALDARLLDAVNPRIAVIAVGARNRGGNPAPQTLELLRSVPTFRTDLHGTVDLHSDGHRLWVNTERGGSPATGFQR